MDVSAIPFNRFLGLRAGDTALTLPADPKYHNHLGTVHAGAQFSLAEAASGQWLLDRFGEGRPTTRRWSATPTSKFRRPATGELTAQAGAPPEEAERFPETLTRRGRASIEVRVQILGADGSATLESAFEWFAQRVRA